MLEKILRKIEKLIPKKIYKLAQPIYHYLLAILGTVYYRFPAKNMTVIGITGTKGKTSTANFIHAVLSKTGKKVGLISTANIKIGEKDLENKYHMSMPGRFILQRYLREMKNAGCHYVVLEVTSEGIKQFRHLGLFLDISIFTNLSREHLASHNNSFSEYRKAKMKIFKRKIINRPILALLNKDDENFTYFEKAHNKIPKEYFSLKDISDIKESREGVSFVYKDFNFKLNVLGRFNIYNALPAILLGEKYGLSFSEIEKGLESLKLIPGRMEEISLGQNFKVIVDYAHEKLSMNNLLDSIKELKNNSESKIIIVLGGDGGGRDEQRLFDIGKAAGEKADIVIVSNSDPYFDNELELAKKIGDEAQKFGKIYEENLFIIIDRKEAIFKAISLAKDGDIVLLTTRGSLNTMSLKGKKVFSDDRVFAKEALESLK